MVKQNLGNSNRQLRKLISPEHCLNILTLKSRSLLCAAILYIDIFLAGALNSFSGIVFE